MLQIFLIIELLFYNASNFKGWEESINFLQIYPILSTPERINGKFDIGRISARNVSKDVILLSIFLCLSNDSARALP